MVEGATGSVFWHPDLENGEAFSIREEFYKIYKDNNCEHGWLGYPIREERVYYRSYQAVKFQMGYIWYSLGHPTDIRVDDSSVEASWRAMHKAPPAKTMPTRAESPSRALGAAGVIEIDLGEGRCVQVDGKVDADDLRQVLDALTDLRR